LFNQIFRWLDLNNKPLRVRVVVFIMALVLLAFGLAFIPTALQGQFYLKQEFLKRGHSLAKNFALTMLAPLTNQNAKAITLLSEKLLLEPEIRWIGIYNNANELLYYHAPETLSSQTLDRVFEQDWLPIEKERLVQNEPIIAYQVICYANKVVLAGAQSEATSALWFDSAAKDNSLSSAGNPEPSMLNPSGLSPPEERLGKIRLGFSLTAIQKRQRSILLLWFFLLLLALALCSWLAIFFSGDVFGTIRNMGDWMEEFSKRDGDLTRRLTIQTQDEFGKLAKNFNLFLENLQGIIGESRQLVQRMNSALEDIAATSEELNTSSDSINENVQAFTHDFQKQEQETVVALTHMREVVETLISVTQRAEHATRIFEEVMEFSQQGQDIVQETIVKIDGISDNMSIIETRFKNLTISLEKISNFVETIQGIAAQTELLSLNAAIEAARAGDAGRGFAVVASEVGKLAEDAGVASEQISNIISLIQREMQSTSQATRFGAQSVQEGKEAVHQAKESLKKIFNKTNQAATISVENSEHMQRQSEVLQTMMERIRTIQAMGKQNFSTAQTMAASVEEQTASLEQITTAIQELSEDSVNLRDKIIKFKI
jgi:methyl-accepting chemotaxis protein